MCVTLAGLTAQAARIRRVVWIVQKRAPGAIRLFPLLRIDDQAAWPVLRRNTETVAVLKFHLAQNGTKRNFKTT